MSTVELSIQLQTRDIAAVQQAYAASVLVGRDPDTLWWLVDSVNNIVYENRVKGATISSIDENVTHIKIALAVFGDWFTLQNAYFSQDQPLSGVQNLKQAIENTYRWRVSQHFNDVAKINGAAISPLYLFPYPNFNVGTYQATGASAGTYTKGTGPIVLTDTGPGILSVTPLEAAIGGAGLTLALTVVYPDTTTGTMAAIVPGGSGPDVEVVVGEATVSAADATTGIVTVSSAAGFKTGPLNLVIIREDKRDESNPYLYLSEVVEVVAIAGNQLTLRKPTPAGAALPFPNGLRNTYTTAARVCPLFTDVNAITNSTGTNLDEVWIRFQPDWPQGFVDVSSISTPQ